MHRMTQNAQNGADYSKRRRLLRIKDRDIGLGLWRLCGERSLEKGSVQVARQRINAVACRYDHFALAGEAETDNVIAGDEVLAGFPVR
jgi:hypothetical protein